MNGMPEWRQWPDGELHFVRKILPGNPDSIVTFCRKQLPVEDTRIPAPEVEGPRCTQCMLNHGEDLRLARGGWIAERMDEIERI